MIIERVFVAINDKNEVQWVTGSSQKTRYFKTDKYLSRAIRYHNRYHPDDRWKMAECRLDIVATFDVPDELELP